MGEFRKLAALYKRLANDGFPVCEVCGETPAQPEHCKELEGKRKRRATHAGENIELPPASAATGSCAPSSRTTRTTSPSWPNAGSGYKDSASWPAIAQSAGWYLEV